MSWLEACLVTFACGMSATSLAEEPIQLTPDNEPSAVFGGSEATFTYRFNRKVFRGTLTWVHSAHRRTIARGEVVVDDQSEIAIELNIPPVRDGVVFETTLSVALLARDRDETVASHSRRVWVFPRDPFVGGDKWLDSLDIKLFDPKGDTRIAFQSLKIPFQEVRSTGALAEVDSGTLIVGEGVSWHDFRALGELLPSLAANGVVVVCLAPAPDNGKFIVPGTHNAKIPVPEQVTFRRADAITRLDKRLDSTAWTHDGELIVTRLAITGDRGRVTADASTDATSWPWLEFAYSGGGKWIVSGFGVIRYWEDSPNARYFLIALLDDFLQSRGDER